MDQLRSELLKLRTTRTNVLLVLWLVVVLLLVVLLHVLSFKVAALSQKDNQTRVAGLATTIGGLFAAMLGALSITGEFRSGTIRPTLLVTPSRTKVLAGKVVVSALAGAGLGLLAGALVALTETLGLTARGVKVDLGGTDYLQLIGGGGLAAGLLAVVGVGIGAAVRDQVATLIGLCLWFLFVEPLLIGDVLALGKYAPEASAGALAGALQTRLAEDLVAPAVGGALLALYAGMASLVGSMLFNRRDID